MGWLRSFQKADTRVKVWSEVSVWRQKWVGSFPVRRRNSHEEASYEASLRMRGSRGVQV